MKLFVIVLCLLSERFLVHACSIHRWTWLNSYWTNIEKRAPKSPWGLLALMVIPLLLIPAIALFFMKDLLFGAVGIVLNVIFFYYSLGPGNPFYPVRPDAEENISTEMVGHYLAQVNGQVFAVIFWYAILGPIAALAYRLISLSQQQEVVAKQATGLTGILDWLPAKMTSLLYLFVGNFQAGFYHFSRLFFTKPEQNNAMLSLCGLQAVGYSEQEEVLLPHAEILVEHALIVLLVLIALFTMVAWL